MKIIKTQLNINIFLSFIIIAVSVFISYSIIAKAQEGLENISYPIKELGGCKNQQDCKDFCDKKENISACVNFAEKKGMISEDDVQKARAFAKSGEGPGGCQTKEQCEKYCDDQGNMEVCLNFAKEHKLMSEQELNEGRKIMEALKGGAQLPGGCKSKEQCDDYCNDINNIRECVAFGEKAGIIPESELKEAKQVMKAFEQGIKPPGGCRGKKDCDNYCSEPSHMEECFNFAEKAGFIPPEELEQARKMMPMMIRGEMPGGCKTKEQCESYCSNDANVEECGNFALKAGLMKPEEAEMFRKTGGKGPGGCRGKEQCETFCNNSDNQEACFKFGQENGLIPEEKIKEMKEGMTRLREGIGKMSPDVSDCLKQSVGTENFDKIQAGTLTPGPQIGDQIKNCFEKFGSQGIPGREGPGGPMGPPTGGVMGGEFEGPGGCSNPQECTKYCSENPQECAGFEGGSGQDMMPPNREMLEKMLPEGMELPEDVENILQGPPTDRMPGSQIPEEYRNMMPPQQMPPPPNSTIPSPEQTSSNIYRVFLNLLKNLFR